MEDELVGRRPPDAQRRACGTRMDAVQGQPREDRGQEGLRRGPPGGRPARPCSQAQSQRGLGGAGSPLPWALAASWGSACHSHPGCSHQRRGRL